MVLTTEAMASETPPEDILFAIILPQQSDPFAAIAVPKGRTVISNLASRQLVVDSDRSRQHTQILRWHFLRASLMVNKDVLTNQRLAASPGWHASDDE